MRNTQFLVVVLIVVFVCDATLPATHPLHVPPTTNSVGLHAGMWMEFQIFHRFTEKRRSIYTNNNNMFLYVQTHTQYPQPIHGAAHIQTSIHTSNGQVCTNVSSIYTYTAADIAASVMAFLLNATHFHILFCWYVRCDVWYSTNYTTYSDSQYWVPNLFLLFSISVVFLVVYLLYPLLITLRYS